MSDCPSDADLSGFLDESLPPERLAVLSAHVDGCPKCQVRLDGLTHDSDSAVARYKELSSIIDSGPGTVPSSPDAGTLILGVDPPRETQRSSSPGAPKLVGLPVVPGFDVAAEIGRGGMGVVYRARHRRLNRLCALKMVLAGGAADTVTVQRFLFEAEILARVQHPQVVQVFEVDTYQGPSGVPIPYLAMELLEGGSLGARIREGPMAPRVAAELIEGLARAVHAAHLQGVIHRDLKPGNILFPEVVARKAESGGHEKQPGSGSTPTSDSMRFAPKVTDFGLAKFIEAGADMTQTGQVVGTPHYMAPEQAKGGKQIGPPADVYALGAMLFECLAGRRPFEGNDPMHVLMQVAHDQPPEVISVRPDVPRDLAAVVSRCLSKEPRRRYASAADFADDLRRFQENRPTVARPLRRRERLWLWAKRNPAVAALTAALSGVLVLAFVLVTVFWLRAEEQASKEREAKDEADRLARVAKQREKDALTQTMLAEQRQAELEFARARNTCEEGRVDQGLREFLRALELAEGHGERELARVIRANYTAWRGELLPPRRAFTHKYQPRTAAFLPDGRHMVAAGRGGEIHRWNLDTGEKVLTYKNPGLIDNPLVNFGLGVAYWSVAVSPDGKTVAAGGSDRHITLWDADSGQRRASFRAVGGDGNVWMVAFAPDGTLWSNDGWNGIKRWDLSAKSGPVATRFRPAVLPRDDVVQALEVSADGRRVYSGDRAGFVREWDAATGEHTRSWWINSWVADLAVSSDGSRVAATGPEGFARVFHRDGSRPPTEIDLAGAYGNGIAFAPKRPYVLTSDADGNVRVWHQDTGQPIGYPYRFSGEVTKIRFRKDSDEFAVPAGDSVFVTRVPDPPVDVLSAGFGQRVRGLDFSGDGKLLAATDDNNLQVFDPLAGSRVRWLPYQVLRNGQPARVALSPLTLRYDPDPARSRVLRGIRSGVDWIAVPDGRGARQARTTFLGRVRQIEFCPNTRYVFAIDPNSLARFDAVDLAQQRIGVPAPGIPSGVELQALAARPDGKELLVSAGKRVMFLDPQTLKLVREWRAGGEVLDARYTPDGKRVLVGRSDNVAQLLDAATGAEVLPRSMPHSRAVTAVGVSPSGKVLLTGSRDQTARFWDAETGWPLGPPLRHLGPVTHARFAPDGDHIATGTGRGHVMIWDIPPRTTEKTLEELRAEIDKLGG